MTIFLSHSRAQKPLVREIWKVLPEHINSWIDEEKLLIGDSLVESLERAIKKESDYILLFIDEHTCESEWIRKEILWTLEAEQKLERSFLLPVVIEAESWSRIQPDSIRQRKYIKLDDYSEKGVRSLADRITSELFSLICRDIHVLRNPNNITKAASFQRTEDALNQIAESVRKIVFSYRQSKPLAVADLRAQLARERFGFAVDDFENIMGRIIQHNLIPGLSYDGFELYVTEEHYRWKANLAAEAKKIIAKAASSKVRSGQRIALDAGSTTDELARILCRRIENKSLSNLTVLTTSISAANIFLDAGTRLGVDEDSSPFRLILPAGRVRPNTLAIVEDLGRGAKAESLEQLLSAVGPFDCCFLGVNGVDLVAGFTTHSNFEATTKRLLIQHATTALVLGDGSKFGIVEDAHFAAIAENVILVTNEDTTEPSLTDALIAAGGKVLIAK